MFSCERSLCFGGTLQHVAFFAGGELSTTKVSAGYRTALVYGLSLRSASSAAAIPFAAPSWPNDVQPLRALLLSWNARLSSEGDRGARPPPLRAIIMLDSTGESRLDALQGSDKALCCLVRHALEGCPGVGGYLARLTATEHCVAESIRDDHDRRHHWNRYDEESDSDEHDVGEYDWDIDRTDWALKDWVDLRTGVALGTFSKEARVVGDEGSRDVMIPDDAREELTGGDPRKFVLDEDDGESARATRKFSRIAVVLSLTRDAWHELAAGAGVDVAFARLLSEVETADRPAGGGAASGSSSLSSPSPSSGKRARLAGSPSGDSPDALSESARTLLTEAVSVRGPLAVATSLFDSFVRRRSADARLPPALLQVILAGPRTPSPAPLLSRIFSDFAHRLLIDQDPRLVAAALSMVAGDPRPADALCRALRSSIIHVASPLFVRALQLARVMLGYPVQADSSLAAIGPGQKRRRGDGEAGSILDLEQQAARGGPLQDHGRALLSAIACSFPDEDPLPAAALHGIVKLTLVHCQASEVEAFVKAKLHIIARDPLALAALFEPRDEVLMSALERGIIAGLPQLASRPRGPLMLLALAWLLCSLGENCSDGRVVADERAASMAGAAASAVGASDAAPGATVGAQFAAQVAAVVRLLPSEPCETSTLSLVEASAPHSALGLRVHAKPVLLTNERVERVLQAIVVAWPSQSPQLHGAGPLEPPTLALLKLLLTRPTGSLAADFVARRLEVLVQSSSASSVLIDALVPKFSKAASGLWEGVARGINDVLNPERLAQYHPPHYPSYMPRPGGSNGVASSAVTLAGFVNALASRTRDAKPPLRRVLLQQCSRVLRTLAVRWPANLSDTASVSAALQVLRSLVLEGDVDSAASFLSRLSPDALLNAPRRVVVFAVEKLGWAPFGVSLGRAIASAIQAGPAATASGAAPRDLAAAARVGLDFVSDASNVSGARAGGSVAFTAAARAVMLPVIRAVTDLALGVVRVRLAPLTDAGCAGVASFIFDAKVSNALIDNAGHIAYPPDLPTVWARYAASEAGRAAYPVESLVGFVRKALSGDAGYSVPRPSLRILLDALVSAEAARLATPVPPLTWQRSPACPSCTINPTGPSSCASINSFMVDPTQRVATFIFTNMTKLKHASGLFRRSYYCNVEQSERQLRVTKMPDASAAAAHNAAVQAQARDRARLSQIEGLRQRCLVAASVAGGAAAASPSLARRGAAAALDAAGPSSAGSPSGSPLPAPAAAAAAPAAPAAHASSPHPPRASPPSTVIEILDSDEDA